MLGRIYRILKNHTRFYILAFVLLFSSCYSRTKEDALRIFQEKIENTTWKDFYSKSSVSFKEGLFNIYSADTLSFSGKYDLVVEPAYGLTGKWHSPIREIHFKKGDVNKVLELYNTIFDSNFILLKNDKTEKLIFLTNKAKLDEVELSLLEIHQEVGFKPIKIDSLFSH